MTVITIELGLITPPIGLNVFVIKSMETNLKLGQVFKAIIPFIVMDIFRLVLLVAFPILVLWLPNSMG
ncbi:TRAP transporter large permease subunit [uncultured Roseibium sp.]|uniref:TRAP transporter large permease subunit n=1 Tax=uncultured Roseibium sp. TaxID=1936171 RepID=UPI0032177750